jgi:polar amino acid transport system permease protein
MSTTALPRTATPERRAAGAPPADAADLATRRVVPLAHPGRWVASIVVLVLVAQVVHGLVTNQFYEWHKFGYWFSREVIVDGLKITLRVTAWAAVLGFLGGLVLALARLSKSPLLRAVSWLYVWFFRSLPLIVLLIFLVNFSAIYPTISIGIPFGPAFARFHEIDLATYEVIGIVGLAINEAAYAAELIRGGILSVDHGQVEAAHALGLSGSRRLRRVVLPQALRTIVPGYVNQLIGLIKSSSLLYYVSLADLFGAVEQMGSTYPTDIVPLLLVASVWYLILTSALSVVQYYVERYFARGAVRTLPPTPWQQVRAAVASFRERFSREALAR